MKRTLLFLSLVGIMSYSAANTTAKNVPAVINASQNTNWELIQKNQQLENDIRKLRGQLEEFEYQLDTLKNELNNRYNDLDQRMELLNQKIDPVDPSENVDSSADTDPAPTNATTSSVTPEQQAYTVALDVYKKQGAKAAIAPMEKFIRENPSSIYIANAHYWLGGFYLSSEPVDFAAAKKNFNTVVNQYPKSSKVSAALYQLFDIADKVDQNPAQAAEYKNRLLRDFPQSKEASYLK